MPQRPDIIARARRCSVAPLLLLLALLGGCGGKPIPFPVPESEMGDRPGIFTGDKGAWEVLPRDDQRPDSR